VFCIVMNLVHFVACVGMILFMNCNILVMCHLSSDVAMLSVFRRNIDRLNFLTFIILQHKNLFDKLESTT
jgi:hypothetical protein